MISLELVRKTMLVMVEEELEEEDMEREELEMMMLALVILMMRVETAAVVMKVV